MKIYALTLGIIAVIFFSCTRDTDEFEGPALDDLYGGFAVLEGLDISNRNVDFSANENTFFTARFSKNVDWERDDLFHLSLDKLSGFLCEKITRNFVIRNDYGLYEYTVYVLKK